MPISCVDNAETRLIRCAIYTRKSTDENLDLEFNTLDAQRVACSAYIISQRHENWIELPERYDDGGYSGGDLDRPALKRLIEDVRQRQVDVIAVYKVDRLTRSLLDFARIMSVLDESAASFVSITQSFNSTTSMGRLTLNVLLSFAQFERELASERVRDKIAASKAKGLWVGGTVPLGYDAIDKKLVINPEEAATVRKIFERYNSVCAGRELVRELAEAGVRNKPRRRNSSTRTQTTISLGALYALLRNRLYIGEIAYRGKIYKAVHEPIISPVLFEQVGVKLDQARVEKKVGINAHEPSLLTGLMHDGYNRPMVPSHTQRGDRRYRYYCSQDAPGKGEREVCRVSAHEVERAVLAALPSAVDEIVQQAAITEELSTDELHRVQELAETCKQILATGEGLEWHRMIRLLVLSIVIVDDRMRVLVNPAPVVGLIAIIGELSIEIPVRRFRSRKTLRIVVPPAGSQCPTTNALLEVVTQAFIVRRMLENGRQIQELARTYKWHEDYVVSLMRVALLAPSVLSSLLDGTQPEELNRRKLMQMTKVPLAWFKQREVFGF